MSRQQVKLLEATVSQLTEQVGHVTEELQETDNLLVQEKQSTASLLRQLDSTENRHTATKNLFLSRGEELQQVYVDLDGEKALLLKAEQELDTTGGLLLRERDHVITLTNSNKVLRSDQATRADQVLKLTATIIDLRAELRESKALNYADSGTIMELATELDHLKAEGSNPTPKGTPSAVYYLVGCALVFTAYIILR